MGEEDDMGEDGIYNALGEDGIYNALGEDGVRIDA